MNRIFLVLVAILSLSMAPVWAGAVQVGPLLTCDNSIGQLANGYVYTYAAGTTTPKSTYLDSAKTQTAANPVVLDPYGRASIYADGVYKFVIKTSDNVTVATYDNLEFISAVNPTTIVTTNLTVSSMTADLAYFKSATIATGVISSTLLSACKISDCALLASPTLAYHPVDKGTFDTQFSIAVNPHGTTLTQTNLVASHVTAPSIGQSTTTGRALYSATGTTLVGNLTENNLVMEHWDGSEAAPMLRLRTDNQSGYSYLDFASSDVFGASAKSIKFDPYTSSVNFGGLTLTNCTVTPSAATASATYFQSAGGAATLLPLVGGGSITIASYTITDLAQAVYMVDWCVGTYSSGTNTALLKYSIQVNGGTVDSRYWGVPNHSMFLSQPQWSTMCSLKVGDVVSILAECAGAERPGDPVFAYSSAWVLQGHLR